MKYKDLVYGEFEITEPVVLEIINSSSLQRLKDIDQAGYRPLWVKPDVKIGQYDHSRFAHSLGVYLLLLKHNASLEERIAGLIHDVSHAAFSHCIDYVLDVGSETEHNHQDNILDNFIKETQLPEIIKKHNLDLEYILDDKNFPLKEKNLPDLCADRIDYSLKTAVIFGEIDEEEKKYLLSNLIVRGNDWAFKNFKSAKKYADLFFKLNTVYYAGFPSAVMFRAVGDCLKHALKNSYISEQDLYTTDLVVLKKLKKFLDQDERLNLLWQRMNNQVEVKNDPNNYDAQVFCKSRIVDPLFLDQGKSVRVSQADPNWAKVVTQESVPKKYFLKFSK